MAVNFELTRDRGPIAHVQFTTTRRIAELIASPDRRKRKRGWRLYRKANAIRWARVNQAFESMAVAAAQVGAQVNQFARLLQAAGFTEQEASR